MVEDDEDEIERLIEEELRNLDDWDITNDVEDLQTDSNTAEEEDELDGGAYDSTVANYLQALKDNEKRAESVLQESKELIANLDTYKINSEDLLEEKLKHELYDEEENVLCIRDKVLGYLEEQEKTEKNAEENSEGNLAIDIIRPGVLDEIKELEEQAENELKQLRQKQLEDAEKQRKVEDKRRKEEIVFNIMIEERKFQQQQKIEKLKDENDKQQKVLMERLENELQNEEEKIKEFKSKVDEALGKSLQAEQERLTQIKGEMRQIEDQKRKESVICIQKHFRRFRVQKEYLPTLSRLKKERIQKQQEEFKRELKEEQERRAKELKMKMESEKQKLEEIKKAKEREQNERIIKYNEKKMKVKEDFEKKKESEENLQKPDKSKQNLEKLSQSKNDIEKSNQSHETLEKLSQSEENLKKSDQSEKNLEKSDQSKKNLEKLDKSKQNLEIFSQSEDNFGKSNQSDENTLPMKSLKTDEFSNKSDHKKNDDVSKANCNMENKELSGYEPEVLVDAKEVLVDAKEVLVDAKEVITRLENNTGEPIIEKGKEKNKIVPRNKDISTGQKSDIEKESEFIGSDSFVEKEPGSVKSPGLNIAIHDSFGNAQNKRSVVQEIQINVNKDQHGEQANNAGSSLISVKQPVVPNKPSPSCIASNSTITADGESGNVNNAHGSEAVILSDMARDVCSRPNSSLNSEIKEEKQLQKVKGCSINDNRITQSDDLHVASVPISVDGSVDVESVSNVDLKESGAHKIPLRLIELYRTWCQIISEFKRPDLPKKKNRMVISASDRKLPSLSKEHILQQNNNLQGEVIILKDIKTNCKTDTLSKHCPKLKVLCCQDCHFQHCGGFDELQGVCAVMLRDCLCSNVVLKLKNLTILDISSNKISTLHGLNELTSLQYLNASNNNITRISGIEFLVQLLYLNLDDNQIISTKGLQYCHGLISLSLRQNNISSLPEIEYLHRLVKGDFSGNNISAAPLFTNNVLLCSLVMNENVVTKVDNLCQAWLPLLCHLSMENNSIQLLPDLSNLMHLKSINLKGNFIKKTSDVFGIVNNIRFLEQICLEDNPLIAFPKKISASPIRKYLVRTITSGTNLEEYKDVGDPFSSCCLDHARTLLHLCTIIESNSLVSKNHEEILDIVQEKMKSLNELHYQCKEILITQKNILDEDGMYRSRDDDATVPLHGDGSDDKSRAPEALISLDESEKNGGSLVKVVDPGPSRKNYSTMEIQKAIVIQAFYRGYKVRKAYLSFKAYLASAENAMNDGIGDDDVMSDFDYDEEINLKDFEMNKDLMVEWKPGPTPSLPTRVPPLPDISSTVPECSRETSAFEENESAYWRCGFMTPKYHVNVKEARKGKKTRRVHYYGEENKVDPKTARSKKQARPRRKMELKGIAAAVKRIVDVKIAKDGTRYFRICWKDTWEPEAHLLSCQDLLDDFLNNRNHEQKEPENSFVSLTDHKTSPKIQCDLINTTTNKPVDPTPDKTPIQTTCSNIIKSNVPVKARKEDEVNNQFSLLTRQMLDFSAQFHSCCATESQDLKTETELVDTCPKDSFCQCGEIQESTETRDVGCQCEPVVRHFAVQKQDNDEKPEVAEVCVQAEPTVCSTSTQYIDPLRGSQKNFVVKKTNITVRTPKEPQNVVPKITVDTSPVSNEEQRDLVVDNQETANQQLQVICERGHTMQYSNLVELDYSQIPADLLQQILQNTTAASAPQQLVQRKASDNVVDDSLKPMYFVVDGNTDTIFDQRGALQASIQSQSSQGNMVTSNMKSKGKTSRGRKRKSEVEVKTERAPKQMNKVIHSRNLFPQDINNLQLSNVSLQQSIASVNPTLVVPLTVNASVFPAVESPSSGVNSPIQANLNESNVSVVSTVYDPHPPTFSVEAISKRPVLMTTNFPGQISVSKSQVTSFRTEENKINEDFISKYWK